MPKTVGVLVMEHIAVGLVEGNKLAAPPNIYPAATMVLGATTISIYLPPLAPTTITVSPVGAFNLQANTDGVYL